MTKPKDWTPFHYATHVELLRSFLEKKQAERNPTQTGRNSWSLGSWAKRLNLSSAAPLSNILKGRSLPSNELIVRMSETMGLDTLETEFFTVLVEYERHKSSIDVIRNALQARITELKLNQV